MPISINYVARETGVNLRRNIAMTIAAILTVSVSLGLVGGALLMRQGVNKATLQWRGGVELSVFMNSTAAKEQIDGVANQLKATPEVKKYTFVDKAAAFAEYKRIFANNADLLDVVTQDDLPTSFRIVPQKAELVNTIGRRFATSPGVSDVVYAKDAIDKLLKSTRQRQRAYIGVALVLLFGAVLLIFNAIQLAVLNRRREIEVMKLVGATNWFIRLPFVIEGMIQGVAGAVVAAALIYIFRVQIVDVISDPTLTTGLRSLRATPTEALNTGLFLVVIGALIGGISSALAVRRHLKV